MPLTRIPKVDKLLLDTTSSRRDSGMADRSRAVVRFSNRAHLRVVNLALGDIWWVNRSKGDLVRWR